MLDLNNIKMQYNFYMSHQFLQTSTGDTLYFIFYTSQPYSVWLVEKKNTKTTLQDMHSQDTEVFWCTRKEKK